MASDRISSKMAFWRSFRLFEGLEDRILTQISEAAQWREWPAGMVLFQRGDAGDYLVALVSGRVRMAISTALGRELVLRHVEAGDIMGEVALFDDAPRSADAVALVATEAFILTKRDFDTIAAREPDLRVAIIHYLCRMVRDTTDQLEGIALYNLEARLARFLLFTLRQIHGDDLPPNPLLRLEINQSDIAAVLGATRPKVNRALQSLRDLGAVLRDGDVMECDVAKLRRLSEPACE
ncbi:MAG: CRP-like cAMP-binding protein [Pseudorhodobacter sp.]|jgi:CRP/FNR family cyclic AMP-dependent transcriptional regulator